MMYQKIQKDNNIVIDDYARNLIESALAVADTSFVLPINQSAWKYMLACIHAINGNNFVIIDGVRHDMPNMKTLALDNNRDFLEIYDIKLRHIMESAKKYIAIMYERNSTGVYDWMIICPRNGKFYQVATINAVSPDYNSYEISLSHCVMDTLRKTFPTGTALLFILALMKHYFNTNLRNNTEHTTEA